MQSRFVLSPSPRPRGAAPCGVMSLFFLTLGPPKLSGRSPEQPTKMTGQMTLIRKADGVRDFR
jgi:hypothetical protein